MNQQVNNCVACQDLNYEIIQLTTAKDDLDFTNKRLNKEVQVYKQELPELKAKYEKFKEAYEKSDKTLRRKEDENEELTQKILEFSEKVNHLDTDNKVMKLKISSLQDDKQSLLQKQTDLSQELAKYKVNETIKTGKESPEEENKRLKTEIRELEGQVQDLQKGKDNEEKEKEIMKDVLAAEQARYHGEMNKSKKIIGEVIGNGNNKELEEMIKVLLKNYEGLKKENLGQRQEMEDLEKKMKEREEELKEMREVNEHIKKEMLNYTEKIGVLDNMKRIYQYKETKSSADEFKNFYDCRILADSFFPLLKKKNWTIEFKDHTSYKKIKERESVRVSVLGYEKTGKSFMVSKIMGYEVPQGKLTKTTGICILYPNDTNIPWTALDTPGTNISLRTEYLKNSLEDYFKTKNLSEAEMLRMLYGDNILIESLLHEFVANNSQVLLILVGKLRRDDQRFINRIKEQKDYQGKRIIVVHNLLDCRELEDMEEIIQEDIIDTFGAQKRLVTFDQLQKDRHPYVYLEKDKRDTEHVVMAHETSPAGEYYNNTAIKYVKQVISSCPFSEKFDLVEAFHQHLNMSVKNYLSSSHGIPPDPFILCHDKEGVPTTLSLGNADIYHLKKNSTDEFGQIRTYARDGLETVPFAVKIVTVTTPKGDEKYLQVDLEVSGECKDTDLKYKVQTFNTNVVVIIKGRSEDNTVRSDGETVCETTRKFGEFLITTESIDLEGFTIFKGEKPEITSPVPGIKTISFRLYPQVTDDEEF